MKNKYAEKFGNCDKVFDYLESEYHYTAEDLDFYQPEINDLFESMLSHNLLNPETEQEYQLMKQGIDNFYYDNVVKSRRKKMLM
jgi:hypothetical protein